MSPARKIVTFPGSCTMHGGGELSGVQLAYEPWGELSDSGDNAVLLFTGRSPSAHAASSPEDPSPGWWEPMVGPGRPIDTSHLFVVCVNSLGSCFGSTGPASTNPATGEPYRLRFPVLNIEDIAHAGHATIQAMGLDRLHAVVGASMGGMSALAFTMMYPGVSRRLVSISAATRALPFAIALRSLQREIIRRDPAWNGGDYEAGAGPVQGMQLARKLGMITYRSAKEWDQRFGRERIPEEHRSGDAFCVDFEVEAYLQAHARKFVGQFDANCYLYLSRAMDLFDVGEHGGSVERGLALVDVAEALVIGVETDLLFPLRQQREIAEGLEAGGSAVTFVPLPSVQGHDSFLVDMDRFRPVIAGFFG